MALYMRTELFAWLPDLELPPAAQKMLWRLVAVQEPGGAISQTQTELGLRLGMDQPQVSKALRCLRDRNLVLKKGRAMRLHPIIAGYESDEDFSLALTKAVQQIRSGELADITVPEYITTPPKAGTATKLAAVS
jgi:hypothetical protein